MCLATLKGNKDQWEAEVRSATAQQLASSWQSSVKSAWLLEGATVGTGRGAGLLLPGTKAFFPARRQILDAVAFMSNANPSMKPTLSTACHRPLL